MSPLVIVARKELVDGCRDRRAVLSLLVFPLVGPVLVSTLLSTLVERATVERTVTLPVLGMAHAPALVAHLEAEGIVVVEGPSSPVDVVRSGASEAVLVVGADYPAALREGRRARLQLVVDESREGARPAQLKIRRALANYGRTVGALRLLSRGVSPELAEGIVTEEVDLATPEARGAVLLNFVPMFALMAAVFGGMHLASDLTAGERERGSLEPLLFTPVSRRALVLGKWLAALAFAASNVVLTLGCTAFAMSRVPLERFGMAARLSVGDVLLMLGVLLPLAMFTSALQLLVASFARTVKEAQVSLSLLTFAPMLPALFLSFEPLRPTPLVAMIPVLGQQSLLGGLLRGEVAEPSVYFACAASCIAFGALALLVTARLFASERVVYGR